MYSGKNLDFRYIRPADLATCSTYMRDGITLDNLCFKSAVPVPIHIGGRPNQQCQGIPSFPRFVFSFDAVGVVLKIEHGDLPCSSP